MTLVAFKGRCSRCGSDRQRDEEFRKAIAKTRGISLAREVKNNLCIDGHLNKALDQILESNSPDGIFAILTHLAHRAVDMSFTALGQGVEDEERT